MEEYRPPKPRSTLIPAAIIAVLVAGGAAYYFWKEARKAEPATETAAVVPAPAATAPVPEPAAHYEVPPAEAPAEAKPLPALNESDGYAQDALKGLIGAEAFGKLVLPQELVRRIVVTVDNLARKNLAVRLNPVKPVGGEFRTAGKDDNLVIAPDNASRYDVYVRAVDGIDTKKFIAAYGRLYPLFQKAYEDLGYPKGYFNDRLIAVIDNLLATPEVAGPIALVVPHVQPQFADPQLEALSAGQKVLLRMGTENAAVVKSKLREIRKELTGGGARR